MRQINISTAKAQLSRQLDYVRAGGRVRIVDRTIPIADLVPVQQTSTADGDDGDALIRSLERRGVGHRGNGTPLPRSLFRPGPRRSKAGRLSDAVLAERRSSW